MGGILLQKSENLAVDGVHQGPLQREINVISTGGRMISSLPGVFEVYLEDYSPATEIPSAAPDLAAWAGSRALARRQQGLDLGAARGRHAAAQTRAFEAGRRRGEP